MKSQEKLYEIVFIHLQLLYPGQGSGAFGAYPGNTGHENMLKLLRESNQAQVQTRNCEVTTLHTTLNITEINSL